MTTAGARFFLPLAFECLKLRQGIIELMCGRYTLTAKQEELARKFLLKLIQEEMFREFEPRYNIVPTQPVLTIRADGEKSSQRVAHWHRWGLVPFWARDIKIGYKMINARSETVSEKPAFRNAIKYRRCILPASGFFEWQRKDPQKPKQPYYFHSADGDPLAMAGLWENWQDGDGAAVFSCCMLTTGPNSLMEPIHNRMPVFLEEKDFDCWLDPDLHNPEILKPLLKPCREDLLSCRPVSTLVNSPKNDSPDILEEIDPDTGSLLADSFSGELFGHS